MNENERTEAPKIFGSSDISDEEKPVKLKKKKINKKERREEEREEEKKERNKKREKKEKREKREEQSKTIDIQYHDDYNIVELDEMIRENFKNEAKNIPKLELKIKDLTWIATSSSNTIEVARANKQISKVKEEIKMIQKCTKFKDYESKTASLIEEYKKLEADKKPEQFGTVVKYVSKEYKDKKDYREHILKKYFIFARQFIDMNVTKIEEKNKIDKCTDCDIEYTKDSKGTYCEQCNILVVQIPLEIIHSGGEKGHISNKSDYDGAGHIKDIITKLQGLQKDNMLPRLIPDMLELMEKYSIDKNKLKRTTLITLMKEKGYNNYDDVYLIWKKITEKQLPDFKEIQDRLFKKAEELNRAYNIVKPKSRKNLISAHYSVWELLQQEKDPKYHLRKNFFMFPKMADIISGYDDIMENICKELGGESQGWKFVAASS